MDNLHINTNEDNLLFPASVLNIPDPLQNLHPNVSTQQIGFEQIPDSLPIVTPTQYLYEEILPIPQLILQESFNSPNVNALNTALDFVQGQLQEFALAPNAYEHLNFVFDVTDPSAVQTRLSDWQNSVFTDRPDILFLSNEVLQGAAGAYSASRNTIYLSETLTQPGELTRLPQVLLEEYGHALDQQFNPGDDTAGDEGELFSRIVLGEQISNEELARLRNEDDHGTLNLDGVDVAVEFDNTIGTAFSIGTLIGSSSYFGFVGTTDTNDYYSFTVGNTSNFSLSLTGLSADADVTLLNSSGVAIQSSTLGGIASENISRELTAGDYYVRVYPFSGANTNYNLNLSASPLDGAGNTLALARNIGTSPALKHLTILSVVPTRMISIVLV